MLKSFDFFRKIQTDQQLTSTTGGLYTIFALIAAGLLIIMSFQDFFHEKYFTFLTIQTDVAEYLPVRIDMIFNRMPCEAIQIQFRDQLQFKEPLLEQKLKLEHVKPGEKTGEVYVRDNKNLINEISMLRKHINEYMQCRITGILDIPKTPGTLTFKATANNNALFQIEREMRLRTRMSYRIDTLQFGLGNNTFDFPIAHKSKNIENYIKQLQGNINNRQYVQDFTAEGQSLDFFNHVKIIPVIVQGKDKQPKPGTEKYRYSLRSGSHASVQQTQKVMFYTEIEPINIVYRESDPTAYDLVVQLLAIVGGTVATIGILNSLSHFLFRIK